MNTDDTKSEAIEAICQDEIALIKLNKDIKAAARMMTRSQARHLVDAYYIIQEQRLRFGGQIRSMSDEPHAVLDWAESNSSTQERWIAAALKAYASEQHMGQWAMSVKGIGPIFAANLLAYIDMNPWRCAVSHADKSQKGCTEAEPHGLECKRERLYTVGHIWRFAGLDPTVKWEKGQKRPWNANLKTTCRLIGESFEKLHNNPDSFYGRVYNDRKAYEQRKNEAGDYAEQAKIKEAIVGKKTEAWKHYSVGKLPPGHIRARVLRYTVKLFLSHWHAEAYRHEFNEEPPKPYPIAILGHAHEISPV